MGELSRGDRAIRWIETHCRVPEGAKVGQPIVLLPWQRDLIRGIYNSPTRRAIISFGRKNGKGLALDTPIPTPSGWRTMGDLVEGDYVFGADGRPVRVSFVSDTHVGLRCWRLRFSDGTEIVADEEHQWLTRHSYRPWTKARKNGSGFGGRWREAIVTTPQIAGSLMRPRADGGAEHNHKVGCAPALQTPDVDLPIPPYVLGAWLGDGTSSCAAITCGDVDLDYIANRVADCIGVAPTIAKYGDKANTVRLSNSGVQAAMREIGVLGNKHIPEQYLSAGTAQRWELLQGLMDTDGTVTRCSGKTTPRASFCGTNETLCRGVWRLARSLGLKATFREGVAKLDGVAVSAKYYVDFPATSQTPVFGLGRKQSLLPAVLGKRSGTLTIVSCEEVESVPTRCIQVDALDSLYLAGYGCVPTHNTTLSALLLLLHLCGPFYRKNSQLYSAAQSRDQAAILFALAAKIVRMSPDLNGVVQIRESGKQLFCPELGTLYKALSADASTAYGLSPVFCVHDELGQVKGPRSELYEALETAAGAQDEPLSIVISTQAARSEDLLSILIDDAAKGGDERTKLFLFTAPEELDPFSQEAILAANPAYGEFLNPAEVLDQAASAKRMPSRESAYRNLILNQRVDATSPLISRAVWMGCGAEPGPFEGPVWMGLDLSARNDLTALVMLCRGDDGAWDCRAEFWTPENGLKDRALRDRAPYDLWHEQGFLHATPGSTVDYEWVARRLVELCEEYQVSTIAFDRWRIDLLKNELSKVGAELPLEPFGQGYKSMAPAIDNLEAALLNKQLRHGNHPVLSWCAANAIATRDPAGNRKLDKAKATGRIDGVVALTMAFGVADMKVEEYVTGTAVFL